MPSRLIDRDKGWKAFFKAAESLSGKSYAKVGVLADEAKGGMHEVGPDGKASPLTVAEVAAVMEFGTVNGLVPARPFLRPTFDAQREALGDMAVKGILKILDGQMSVGQVLNLMGAHLAAEVKKTIAAGVDPPNAPSTALAKAKKGRTSKYFKRPARHLGDALAQVGALAAVKPLIDTGRLLGAVTWVVVVGAVSQGLGQKSGAAISGHDDKAVR